MFGFFWTENSGVKLKELLSGLSSITLTDAEAIGVMSLLQERSPSALEAWYKVRLPLLIKQTRQAGDSAWSVPCV